MPFPLSSLAQDSLSAMWDVLIVAGLLIGAVLLLTLVVIAARRHLLGGSSRSTRTGFTLAELRAMHRRGELSDEEYNRARDVLIAQVRAAPNRKGGGELSDDAGENDEFA